METSETCFKSSRWTALMYSIKLSRNAGVLLSLSDQNSPVRTTGPSEPPQLL
jgi:hypothetical protein